MKLPRRQFLHLAAGAAALPTISRIAWAQAYPTRPVKIIVGQAARASFVISTTLLTNPWSEYVAKRAEVRIATASPSDPPAHQIPAQAPAAAGQGARMDSLSCPIGAANTHHDGHARRAA